jgi:glycosyltransferase involved in cell wall biosynthesis
MRNLARWFEQNAVDLAYVSMLKHDAYVAVRAGERMGFPVVLRPEGAGATGDVAWQSWGRFGRKIGLACRQADAFISISKSVEDELHQALESGTMRPMQQDGTLITTRKTPQIVSISNGAPVPELAWRFRSEWSRAPRAVFVGRLAPEKGLEILIQAWPRVRTRFPTAQLILVGEGPERAALENQVRAFGLTIGHGQAVSIPGSVSDSTEALRQADLFVLPSREEGMSIALLEAMALGLPVVASLIPGNRRLIDDLEQGRLIPPGDPIALAGAIIEQWENPDRAAQMGLAARHRVEREFSIEAVAKAHMALFRELVSCH